MLKKRQEKKIEASLESFFFYILSPPKPVVLNRWTVAHKGGPADFYGDLKMTHKDEDKMSIEIHFQKTYISYIWPIL